MPFKSNSSRDGHCRCADEATKPLPSPAAPECDAEDQPTIADKAIAKMPSDIAPIDATIVEIRVAYRKWSYVTDQLIRIQHPLGAKLRSAFGWRKEAPLTVRNAAIKAAQAFIDNAEREFYKKQFDPNIPGYADWQIVALATIEAQDPFRKIQVAEVKEMERLAKLLPVWEWTQDIRGFGAKSLAVIVGEAGNLSNYPKKGHLWKRMGVAVIDGIAQGKLAKIAPKELWIKHGYNRDRRSELAVIGNNQIRQGTHYRGIYLARKEFERKRAEQQGLIVAPAAKIPKKKSDQYISDGHIHTRAQRYMEKMLLRDLLAAWKEADRKTTCLFPEGDKEIVSTDLLPTAKLDAIREAA